MALAFYASAKKYLPDVVAPPSAVGDKLAESKVGKPGADGRAPGGGALGEFITSLNCDELCLALACAKGDESAWEHFFREYRSYLISVARFMVSDPSAAEQLADSTFGELYGVRESGGMRVSKFSFYSGRGSLRGWLRAVVYQLFADSHRHTNRFVQTEEVEELDRLARTGSTPERPSAEMDFIRDRYRSAVSNALRSGLADLDPRERLLLVYYYCDEMTLREVGRLFNKHEATISRWLVKVQKKLRKLVEKKLEREHRFNRSEAREAMEQAAEQAEISIRDYLIESVSSDQPAGAARGPT
jgi:RNA polymerase sigma-70 factor